MPLMTKSESKPSASPPIPRPAYPLLHTRRATLEQCRSSGSGAVLLTADSECANRALPQRSGTLSSSWIAMPLMTKSESKPSASPPILRPAYPLLHTWRATLEQCRSSGSSTVPLIADSEYANRALPQHSGTTCNH